MTVLVCLTVPEGIVLAADSATTSGMIFDQPEDLDVDHNAEKLFSLHYDLPLAAMTCESGSIGGLSVQDFSQRLHDRLSGTGPCRPLNPSNYTIKDVVKQGAELAAEVVKETTGHNMFPYTTVYVVAGYSANCEAPEVWTLTMRSGATKAEYQQVLGADNIPMLLSFAQDTAIRRLYGCCENNLRRAMDGYATLQPLALSCALEKLGNPVTEKMSLIQAARFAEFLVNTTIGFVSFRKPPHTVGGNIRIATITRNAGYRNLDPIR
ncbi:hypothetical protein, partial [Streptomyces sp. NPDC059071]|uniref:hypothetical protein n=1 Tax=Streptomyces sp. NPDC059071 TaxID=3346714 RepID=UPI00368163E9